jgi:DNA-binding response OmpR family regulator
VEDEFGIADLIEAVLEDEGHRVLTAGKGSSC